MATKNMEYAHPAYISVHGDSFACAAGANAVSVNKHVAFTAQLIKSATVTVITAGTSAGAGTDIIIKAITGQGTTTTAIGTATLGTSTSGVSVNVPFTANNVLAQGDQITFTNGTDATAATVVALEYVLQPLANVTV